MCLFVSSPSQSFPVSPATAAATHSSHLIFSLLKLFPQLLSPACPCNPSQKLQCRADLVTDWIPPIPPRSFAELPGAYHSEDSGMTSEGRRREERTMTRSAHLPSNGHAPSQ